MISEPQPRLSPGGAVTTCVIARDAAADLAEMLPGLRWADEVLVLVDDRTRDDSVRVAHGLSDRVVLRPFASFPAFRNLALDLARTEWVFFVDADERVSQALADEVREVVMEGVEGAPSGYWVPRHNLMFGRLIRGGGWWPDHQLRLLRRTSARYDETRLVHELVEIAGQCGYLTQALLHFNYRGLSELIEKQQRYTAMEAAALVAQGQHARRRTLVGAPLREFTRRFFTLGGWRDGPVGLFLALAMAYYSMQQARLTRRG